ncbi:MAG: hypothetical protein R3B90_11235 [Planctomycetaceae bacterium]
MLVQHLDSMESGRAQVIQLLGLLGDASIAAELTKRISAFDVHEQLAAMNALDVVANRR